MLYLPHTLGIGDELWLTQSFTIEVIRVVAIEKLFTSPAMFAGSSAFSSVCSLYHPVMGTDLFNHWGFYEEPVGFLA